MIMIHNQEARTFAKHPETRLPVGKDAQTGASNYSFCLLSLLIQAAAFYKRPFKGRTFLIATLTPAAVTLAAL